MFLRGFLVNNEFLSLRTQVLKQFFSAFCSMFVLSYSVVIPKLHQYALFLFLCHLHMMLSRRWLPAQASYKLIGKTFSRGD